MITKWFGPDAKTFESESSAAARGQARELMQQAHGRRPVTGAAVRQ